MKTINKFLTGVLASSIILTACTKKLDQVPFNDITDEKLYQSAAGYTQAFAKLYASFATTGSFGPGSTDVAGLDAGTGDFLRLYWKLNELTTDEAVVAWGDPGIQDFHNMNWTTDNPMSRGLYLRCQYQITLANEFLRQSTASKLSERGISGADATRINGYRPEARFLRAFQYWVLMDLYGNPSFTDENYVVGSGALPNQISRANLFTYIENELKALENELPAARTNEYGRSDKAACQALLARLYLNAQVYTGTARWNDAATYARKVIDVTGYSLIGNYRHLMVADNNTNTSENIFTINYDGTRTQTFGGTTFLTHASLGGNLNASNFGVDFAWGGLRTTRSLPDLFPDLTGLTDRRSNFHTSGQNININSLTTFTDGLAVLKYTNKTKAGANGSNATFVDVDFPLFRLSEMYLIYAECFTRGASTANAADALAYINLIRQRAYLGASGNISSVQLTTDFCLDERARELYWEGFRRTDLIRYNKFVEGTYLWQWKGGVASGTAVNAKYKLFPLPSSEVAANPNLIQNSGYN
jgi:starch-binding outer membrane protein, SusD/RagB family